MVDPITAGLAGIALVTKVAEHIKSGINAYKSVAELGSQIDALFEGEKQCQQARNKSANKQNAFSTESVAKEVIDHKLAQEKLREVATAIDMRFGHGTWSSILAERQKRIREAKEAERIRIKERQKRIADIQETLTIIAISVAAIGVVLTALFFFSMARL
mgnify:CR=1 FL=1|tara:strand:- start:39938 stop:40417 length:480 start_codon:yes stop_codon:yes gene_type:complete